MTATRHIFTPHNIFLSIILFVACVLRFQYLQEIEHNVDHAYPVWQALQTIENGAFPIIGQGTSVLFANPTLTGYLAIPPLMLSGSIIGVYVLFIALNTLGVYLAYRAFRYLMDDPLALLATTLLAVNPWVIEYSRLSWPPALLPFFMNAVFWLLIPIFMGKSQNPSRRFIIAMLVLGIMTQTTLLAYLPLPAIGLLILIFHKQIPRKAFIIGVGIFVMTQAVYIGGLISTWTQVTQEVNEFVDDSQASQLKLDAAQHAFRLVTGDNYDEVRGLSAPIDDIQNRQELSNLFAIAFSIVLAVGLTIATLAIIRPALTARFSPFAYNYRNYAVIPLLWFGVPIVMLSYNGSLVHPYYLLVGLPAGYVLFAWGVGTILPMQALPRNLVFIVSSIVFGVLMGLNSSRYYQETDYIPGAHGLGALPIDWGLQLGETINTNLLDGGIVYADVDEWILNSFANNLFPVSRDTYAPVLTVIPAQGALYIEAHQPNTDDRALPLTAERVETLELPDGVNITIDRLIGIDTIPANFTSYPVMGEQWLQFEGYDVNISNEQIILRTAWRVSQPTPELNNYIFSPYVHVFDEDMNRLTVLDGQAIQGQTWRTGDVHIHETMVDLPDDFEGSISFSVGQFDGVANKNIIFILTNDVWDALIPLPIECQVSTKSRCIAVG